MLLNEYTDGVPTNKASQQHAPREKKPSEQDFGWSKGHIILKIMKGWSWTRASVFKHRDKAGRDTTALSVLANEELQDVPGLCSAMIHTAKLIETGPWEAFGCNKLLSPKYHSGMAQRLQGRATSQQQHTHGQHGLETAECHPHGLLCASWSQGSQNPVCPGRCT